VTSIGEWAFGNCTGLTSISLPQEVTSIGEWVFNGCTGLTTITVAVDNLNYASIDGVLFNKAGTTLITCPGGLTSISIPQGVTSIGDYAFLGCTGLTTIGLPQGVTSIGDGAFRYCTGLTSINIPQGITSIGDWAFNCCTGLTSISIPQGVTSIGEWTFQSCIGLTSIRFNSATITTIYDDANTIPAATKIIGYDPSTAKDYATKYNRKFEVIGTTPDTTGMTEMKTTQSIVGPSKIWTIKLNALVNEDSIKDQIYITNSQGLNKQVPTCTVTTNNGVSQIKVTPVNAYTSGDYILWVRDIKTVKGTKLKSQVYLKFTVQ